MGRLADWPVLLLGGIIIWLSQSLGAGSAVMLLSITDEERRMLRGIGLVSLAGYAGAALGAVLVFIALPGMIRLIRAESLRHPAGIIGGIIAFAITFPVVMTVGWAASILARWARGEPVGPVAHDTLRLLTETGPGSGSDSQSPWWWIVVAGVLIGAPVLEELVYRGFIQTAVRRAILWGHASRPHASTTPPPRRRAAWTAILITSTLFALMHWSIVEPHALVTLFVLSIAFGITYERTQRLTAPIVMHLLFNAANLGLAIL